MSDAQVNKQPSLITTNSQVRKHQIIANISNMIVSTHTITEEYRESALVISVSDADKGGIKNFLYFSSPRDSTRLNYSSFRVLPLFTFKAKQAPAHPPQSYSKTISPPELPPVFPFRRSLFSALRSLFPFNSYLGLLFSLTEEHRMRIAQDSQHSLS